VVNSRRGSNPLLGTNENDAHKQCVLFNFYVIILTTVDLLI